METQYEEYWHQAMELKHQTHDLITNHDHPQARSLHHETVQLVDDIELGKHPRAVEDRIKTIKRQLIEARAQGGEVLSLEHNQALHHGYDKLQQHVRSLPHY